MTYMLDEIRQQPDVVRRILAEEYPSAEALAAEVLRRQIAYVYVAARGTSENAALYIKYQLEIQNGIPDALRLHALRCRAELWRERSRAGHFPVRRGPRCD